MGDRVIRALLVFVCGIAYAAAYDDGKSIGIPQLDRFQMKYFQAAVDTKPDANVATSGSDVYTILALLYAGSKGVSEKELQCALEAPAEKYKLLSFLNSLRSSARIDAKPYIKGASGIFLNGAESEVEHRFLTYAKNGHIDLIYIDKSKMVSNKVNEWVKPKLDGEIAEVGIGRDTSIYTAATFKADWGFDKTLSRESPFYVDEDTTVNVKTLESTGSYKYGYIDEYGAELLVLPNVAAANNQVYALFILPNEESNIAEVLEAIGEGDKLREYVDTLTPTNATLHVPEFRIESTIDLPTALRKIGITTIFQPGVADLRDIFKNSNHPRVTITHGTQKAVVTFTDDGQTAESGKPELTHVVDFNANRPFAVVIYVDSYRTPKPAILNLLVIDPSKKNE